jgi:tetratricopeptide (TPR) repeat protein
VSNRETMRYCAWLIASAAVVLSGCAAKTAAVRPAPVNPVLLLESADAQLAAGCLDCLLDAHRGYQALRADPSVGSRATAGVIRSALLIAVREHELGLLDSGHLTVARQLLDGLPLPSPELAPIVEIAEVMVTSPSGPMRRVTLEAQTLALVKLSQNQVRWAEQLRARMPGDRVASYVWLSLACGIYGSTVPDSSDRLAVIGDGIKVPLVAFKDAITCARNRREALQVLADAEPRFKEVHFFQGLAALAGQPRPGEPGGAPDLEGADSEFRAAYEWRQDWPSLTLTIANLALTEEYFPRAAEFYDHTLVLAPQYPDALLGKVRALTYLQRYADAITATDELLATGVNPGDARYWRALNQEQLDMHDAAWDDIERADKLIVNGDVPRLAGIIAINRRELVVAREKLELALKRRVSGCDTNYYLQLVHSELRDWALAAAAAMGCAACFDQEEAKLRGEIELFRTSKLPPERRDRQIAKRDQMIATNSRMRATAWFNAAAANYNLGRQGEAREFAQKLVGDQQFGPRVQDLLDRLR